MAPTPRQRWLLGGAAIVAAVLGGVIFAAHDARHRILQALGPRTTVGSITLDYPTVTLHDVHVAADRTPGAWPAAEELDARRVEVDIDASSLWAYRRGEPLAIADIRVADGTMVMLRTPGHLTLLPALRDTTQAAAAALQPSQAAAAGGPVTALLIHHMRLQRMAVDLFDETLPEPHRLHFDEVHGSVGGLALPRLAQAITLDLQGRLRGVEREGEVALKGQLTPAAHDVDLALRLDGVDMLALQPYLLRLGDRPLRHGRLDLVLDAKVVAGRMHAPGQSTVTGLAFADPDGEAGRFAGLERRAALAALKRDGRITLRFTLEGDADAPRFVLAEPIAGRVAAGLGAAVGTGVKDVVHGAGSALKGLLGGRAAESQSPGR